jgi:thymidylate kinase
MIIEFSGSPGTGKSTFVPVVKELLEKRGFLRNVGDYQSFRRYLRGGEAVVVDEGMIHRAVTLTSRSRKSRNPAK